MAESRRQYNLRRRKNKMNASDDLCDTGSISIEGGWYSDTSSQGSQEEDENEEDKHESGVIAVEVVEQNGCSEILNAEDLETCITSGPSGDIKIAEERSKLLGEDDNIIYSDGESESSSDSKGEKLILHADIETAKVLILKGDESVHFFVKAVKENAHDVAKRLKANINEASKELQGSLQNTSEKVHVIYRNVKDNMSETTEKFKTNIGEASERMQDSLQNTSDKIQVMYKNVKDNVSGTMHEAGERADKIRKAMIEAGRSGWYLLSHMELPYWLKDNEYLSDSHRPPLFSFKSCFKSIFKIHTETGNIWTHLIGCLLFIGLLLYFYLRPITPSNPFPKDWTEKLVFGAFFTGAILCLAFSTIFHTVYCHSHNVSKIFSRLDYSGIALLIMGSFIPPLYYGFYCNKTTRLVYMIVVTALGLFSFFVSLYPNFNTPKFRCLRAGVFLTFGCSGIVPAIHFIAAHGISVAHRQASVGWMFLMGVLYILGTIAYASRVPERFFPGRFNIWFQSHQIFHVLVVAAALVHLYGICQMAYYRVSIGTKCH